MAVATHKHHRQWSSSYVYDHQKRRNAYYPVQVTLALDDRTDSRDDDNESVTSTKSRGRRGSAARLHRFASKVKKVLLMIHPFVTPYVKFRRAARAVMMLIGVCNICRELLSNEVSQEPWYSAMDLAQPLEMKTKKKRTRAFVTFVSNEKHELEQITFDVNEFRRDLTGEDILTDELRAIFQHSPEARTPEQVLELVRCMKAMSRPFNLYTLDVQKKMCQCGFYDRYSRGRVILRKGLQADGLFFILSGSLIQKSDDQSQPLEITAGQKFGEDDLICGCARRTTVITRTDSEIFYLHRSDYRDIFNMSVEQNDPRSLDICRKHVIFNHFPIKQLIENPATWSSLQYKYGRLMVKDSTEVEWLYVIKSGEAKVMKYLEPGTVNVKARRREIKTRVDALCPFHQNRQLLTFIDNGNAGASAYSPDEYTPKHVIHPMSAPAKRKGTKGSDSDLTRSITSLSLNRLPSRGQTRRLEELLTPRSASNPSFTMLSAKRVGSDDVDKRYTVTALENGDLRTNGLNYSEDISEELKLPVLETKANLTKSTQEVGQETSSSVPAIFLNDSVDSIASPNTKIEICSDRQFDMTASSSDVTQTGGSPVTTTNISGFSENIKRVAFSSKPKQWTKLRHAHKVIHKNAYQIAKSNIPPFVQIETLHPGDIFGLRACLDPSERGPSASLVSAECEVLQINKRFFMKHCDEAVLGLIRLKARSYPSREELLDRLDANLQWQEYKNQTISEFYSRKRLIRLNISAK